MTETLAEERARLAARIAEIDAEMVAGDTRRFFLNLPWRADASADEVRQIGYSVPIALRVELLAHAPEHLRSALEAGYADRDGAR